MFESTHNLPFEVGPWSPLGFLGIEGVSDEFDRFRVGTCAGLWRSTSTSYDICAISNESPGNGHFDDVLEWFYQSCIRDNRDLKFLELQNPAFKQHLIDKRGFEPSGKNDLIKKLKAIKKEALK